jgi:hypothetical protein
MGRLNSTVDVDLNVKKKTRWTPESKSKQLESEKIIEYSAERETKNDGKKWHNRRPRNNIATPK